MGTLEWIQDWFKGQCNGDWEHGDGVAITTLDNPGWRVVISLGQSQIPLKEVNISRNEHDWVQCKVAFDEERNGEYFYGYGGPCNVEEILLTFRSFVENRNT